jgi:hypothetical protein
MNQGILQFTLGLTTGGFVSSLGAADAKLKSFIGGMLSVGAVTAGVMQAIDRGAELERLHKRTGESVRDLFLLEKGFRAVGLSSEDVSPALFQMQRAIGGVNEMGERTGDIFQRMGLQAASLKRMGGADALGLILQQLGRLNQSDAAKASSSIFGRMQAGNMIQLARSTGEFAEGMAAAADQAAIFERSARIFERLDISMDRVKSKGQALFAGIAEGAAPAIQNVLDMLNNVDLTSLGQEIGRVLTALTQAFREGTVSELIAESLRVGFEAGVAALPASMEKIGYMLLKVFETPLMYLQSGMQLAIEQVMAGLAKIPGLNKAMGLKGFEADSWESIYADEKQNGLKLGSADFGLGDIGKDADKRWAEAKSNIKKISEPLMAMIDGLLARAPKAKQAADNVKRGGSGDDLSRTANYLPGFTGLEKMGFVMGGLGNPLIDPTRGIERNTRRMVELMPQLIQAFGRAQMGELLHQPL